jgi:hypothetical protein
VRCQCQDFAELGFFQIGAGAAFGSMFFRGSRDISMFEKHFHIPYINVACRRPLYHAPSTIMPPRTVAAAASSLFSCMISLLRS